MTNGQIAELDTLERDSSADDADRILGLMTDIGHDGDGLRFLVKRYGSSENEHIKGMLALLLNRASWRWDFENQTLPEVVLSFVGALANVQLEATISTTLNALSGLGARRILRPRGHEDRSAIGDFLVRAVRSDDWLVRSTALSVIARMYSDGILDILLHDSGRCSLRNVLLTMRVDPDDADDWEALRPWIEA